MKKVVILILMGSFFVQCEDDTNQQDHCSTSATIRNLTGLDGCGWVFELNDGTRLEPVRQFICGTPPLPKEVTEDPLYNYEWIDGKSVLINYEVLSDVGTYCMVGPVVRITCISDAAQFIPFSE